MNATNIKNILEAALMVSTQPLTLDKLQGLFARDAVQPDRDALRSALAELAEDCSGRGIELTEVARALPGARRLCRLGQPSVG